MAVGMITNSGRFFWNVEAHVGVGSPNKTEDVHLVQLAFACKAMNPKFPPDAEEKPVYEAVVVGVPCTGSPNDPLCKAIKMAQKKRGGVQDGWVSKIQPSGSYATNMSFMLVGLNNNIVDVLGGNWPYLDRHPKSTAALKELVGRTFVIG
jgi:hypothetical protein